MSQSEATTIFYRNKNREISRVWGLVIIPVRSVMLVFFLFFLFYGGTSEMAV
jgi:hypothetical protein